MKIILRIILLSIFLYSCSNHKKDLDIFKYDTEVIAVFTPRGIGDQSSAGLLYSGMIAATDSLGISFRPIIPKTYEEGAETIAQLAAGNEKGRRRLLISTDPEYSDHLRNLANEGRIVDSDSTKLLVFDGDFTHPDIYTAHVPFYGMMYKAGYVASKMSDVKNVRIYIANDKYRYIREGKNGFIDGFSLNKASQTDVVDFSLINDDNTEGFEKSTPAYVYYAAECTDVYDMVLPICGETAMGFLRYNREFPGNFYTVGVETDMSAYSPDVPFSCVEHLDRVVSACITDWANNQLKHHRRFGLEEKWVELVISENYKKSLKAAADKIHAKAVELEESYER